MTRLLYIGAKADIVAHEEGGKCPAEDFIMDLDAVSMKKVIKLIELFGDRGGIYNTEKFVQEEGPVYALKSHQVRLYCFFLPHGPKRTLVLTHGYIKKSAKARPADIQRTASIYSTYQK